jgi:hypothetical protein
MCRIRRVPPALDQFFHTLHPHVHWDHVAYVRLLVLVMAFAWGRRHVAHRYRYLDGPPHRTRFNHFCLVQRWEAEAARRQKARELLVAWHPSPGETLSRLRDDAKKAKRGTAMDGVAKMKEPPSDAYSRGHQDVCASLVCRDHVIPWGIRLDLKPAHARALALPLHQTTELAAPRIRECHAPAGVSVVVLCDASDLCRTVVKACREKGLPLASTLKSHRRLFTPGWQLKAGRYGTNLFRRRRPQTLMRTKPPGKIRDRCGDAGGLAVSHLGPLHVVFSRTGTARNLLGLVTDAPALSAADVSRTYDKRWTSEPFVKDATQLLGLGPYQNRPYRAAVIHRHLVCCASALLTHLRLARTGAQGQRTRDKAVGVSVAAAQEALRGLIWDDWLTSLKETRHGESVIAELERLRVA